MVISSLLQLFPQHIILFINKNKAAEQVPSDSLDTPLHIVSRYALRTHIFPYCFYRQGRFHVNCYRLLSFYKVWLARDRRKTAQEKKCQNDEFAEQPRKNSPSLRLSRGT